MSAVLGAYIGKLVLMWFIGWGMGFTFQAVRKFFEKI